MRANSTVCEEAPRIACNLTPRLRLQPTEQLDCLLGFLHRADRFNELSGAQERRDG
jgi:hypothetical protein